MKFDKTATTNPIDQLKVIGEPHERIDDRYKVTGTAPYAYERHDVGADIASGYVVGSAIAKGRISAMDLDIGGGFGGKLFLRTDAGLAALGAKAAKRPVKVALTRPMIANTTTRCSAIIQRIRIGAGEDGRITAIGHETTSGKLTGGDPENAVAQTKRLYAGAHRLASNRLAKMDLPEANAMRAPGEAPGPMAIEIAMDEKLGLDPIEFRVIDDKQVDPMKPERPFSRRQLLQCLRQSTGHFGRNVRNARPGQVRDRQWMVGVGVATAFRNNMPLPSGARVRRGQDGLVTVETDVSDIGTGSHTIMAQTAAEMMGVPLSDVGASSFPISAGSGGQFGANSSTTGVYAACVKLREAIAAKLGFNPADDLVFADGEVRSGNRSVKLADAAADGELVAQDTMEWDAAFSDAEQQSTFGAHFVEVDVDVATAEVRVRRMLSGCADERILNPITTRSQVSGP